MGREAQELMRRFELRLKALHDTDAVVALSAAELLVRQFVQTQLVEFVASVEYIAQKTGMVPEALFELFPRIFPQACYDLIILYDDPQEGLMMYMVRRASDDPWFAGELHYPGTTFWPFRNKHATLQHLVDEVGGLVSPDDFRVICDYYTDHDERPRGPCQHLTILHNVDRKTKEEMEAVLDGQFYPITGDELPHDMIGYQKTQLRVALRYRDHGVTGYPVLPPWHP